MGTSWGRDTAYGKNDTVFPLCCGVVSSVGLPKNVYSAMLSAVFYGFREYSPRLVSVSVPGEALPTPTFEL